MQLHNSKLLEALGSVPGSGGWSCPLHGDGTPSMRVHENRVSGSAFFECVNPSCRFYGDAVTLVSAARKATVAEAITMFRPGGVLAHVLKEPLLEAEAVAYTESRTAQSRIQAFLSRCQQTFRQTPEKARFRAGLSQNSLRLVPADMGLLIKGDDMPGQFKEYAKPKYQRANHVVYPFTYNGEVTHVQLQDVASNLPAVTVPITRDDIGVYMERFDEIPQTIVVAPDPRSASIIYGNCTAEWSKKPAIVAAAGFPLPESFTGVSTIYLLSTSDAPLTLQAGLNALAAPEIVSGAVSQPLLKVWSTLRPAEAITAEQVRIRLDNAKSDSVMLVGWVLKEIDKMLGAGNTEAVFHALDAAALPESVRADLVRLGKEKGLSTVVIETLQSVTCASASRLILGNGRLIRRTTSSLKSLTRHGDEEVLANFGISVNHKIRTYSGDAVLVCSVTVQDSTVPPITVSLPESCWFRATAIQKQVVKAFAARGQTPYVAIYDKPGYDWRDILSKLSEKCELYTEVTELGLDDALDLHMPGFVVRPHLKQVSGQRQVFTLPPAPLQMYGGLPSGIPLSACEPFRYLFRRCDNMYVAAFTHGLMHVVHQATAGLFPGAQGRARSPKHLLYVETEAGIWQSAFRQLAAFFSDSDYVPTLNFTTPESTLAEYKQLGALPLIARIPALRGNKFPSLILDSPVSLCGLVDSATAILSTGDLRTTFITPACDKPETGAVISPSDIEDLRQGFAGFLLEFTTRVPMDSVYRSGLLPSQVAYEAACAMLEVEPQPLMKQIARRSFPSMGMTGVNTFFDVMHRVINTLGRKPIFCVVTGRPPVDASFTGRGQHIFVMDDYVVVSRAVVELINKDVATILRFDTRTLTQELQERGLLAQCPDDLDIDTNRCWVLTRETWDANVVRPTIWFPQQLTQGSVIQLKHFKTA